MWRTHLVHNDDHHDYHLKLLIQSFDKSNEIKHFSLARPWSWATSFLKRLVNEKIVIVIVFKTCARLFSHAPAQISRQNKAKQTYFGVFLSKHNKLPCFDISFSQNLVLGDELKEFSKVFLRHSVNSVNKGWIYHQTNHEWLSSEKAGWQHSTLESGGGCMLEKN